MYLLIPGEKKTLAEERGVMPTWQSSRCTLLPSAQTLIWAETSIFCNYKAAGGPGPLIHHQPLCSALQGEVGAPLPSSPAAWSQQPCLDLSVGSASASQGVLHLSAFFLFFVSFFFFLKSNSHCAIQEPGMVVSDLGDRFSRWKSLVIRAMLHILSSLLSSLKDDKTCKSIT